MTKLSEVIAKITKDLKEGIELKKTGVAYMYISGAKVLSLSIEDIEDDTVSKEPAKEGK